MIPNMQVRMMLLLLLLLLVLLLVLTLSLSLSLSTSRLVHQVQGLQGQAVPGRHFQDRREERDVSDDLALPRS